MRLATKRTPIERSDPKPSNAGEHRQQDGVTSGQISCIRAKPAGRSAFACFLNDGDPAAKTFGLFVKVAISCKLFGEL